jgi:hypothetical protein
MVMALWPLPVSLLQPQLEVCVHASMLSHYTLDVVLYVETTQWMLCCVEGMPISKIQLAKHMLRFQAPNSLLHTLMIENQ